MTRADRRSRTKRIMDRRDQQWRDLQDYPTYRPGRARNHSHLSCGTTNCIACAVDRTHRFNRTAPDFE